MVPYGGFWWRVLAYLIDAFVMNIAFSVISAILGFGFMMPMADPTGGTAVAGLFIMVILSFVMNWLYFAVLHSSPLQATLGKLAVGLVVTDLAGERISFLRATGRYFGQILSSMILFIGFIMVGFTERKQGLHDILAGTLVYKTRDPRLVEGRESVFA